MSAGWMILKLRIYQGRHQEESGLAPHFEPRISWSGIQNVSVEQNIKPVIQASYSLCTDQFMISLQINTFFLEIFLSWNIY